MKIKRWLSVLLCMLLCIGLMPMVTYAADSSTLTVNGVNALETSSGEGWKYDSAENTLTLNGYNGGSIVASYMDLKIVLAEGSENIISTSEEYGIAYSQPSFTSPYYDLHIVGAENSTLNITAENHAVYSKGDIFIENLNMIARNTTTSGATYDMECISAEGNITIDASNLNITASTGVGITCYEENTIKNSDITVNAGMIGIHANNKNLKINDTALNITAGTAALYSYFGGIYLENCTGKLTAQTAAIYAQNIDGDSQTELTNCRMNLTAQYGVMTYSDIVIEDGTLDFDCTQLGIYAYSAAYDAVAQVKGNAEINCTEQTPQLMRVNGSYAADDTVDVTGVIWENTGDNFTMRTLFVGDIVLSSDTPYRGNVLIPAGSNATVPTDIAFDLTSAPSVTIEGTLTNKGTLTINGANTNNNGNIYNYGEISLADNENIVNAGKIYSSCTNSYDLTPYAENGILLHTGMVHTDAVAATHLTEGNIEYWYCDGCDKYYSDEAGSREIALENTVIPKLPEHTADDKGWHSDEANHWNTCECGAVINKAVHAFEWVIDKKATATEAGSKHEKCTVCSYAKVAVEIPAAGTATGGGTATPADPGKSTEPDKANPNTGTGSLQTGDNSNIALWIAVMLAAGAALTGTALYSRKKKYNS